VVVLSVAALVAIGVGGTVILLAMRWPRTGRDHEPGALRGLSAAALVCAALFGLIFLAVRSGTGFADIDLRSARWAGLHAAPTSTTILRTLTWLGSSAVVIPLLVVVGLVELRRVPNRSIPAFLVLVEGGQWLLHNILKLLVGRDRPNIDQLTTASGLAFPSGHATNAAAAFAAVALLSGRRRSRAAGSALAATAAGMAALVGTTRVLLGVHWVTDVLAGLALGWGWAALCSIAFRDRLLRSDAGASPPVSQTRYEPGRSSAGLGDRRVDQPEGDGEAHRRHQSGGEGHR